MSQNAPPSDAAGARLLTYEECLPAIEAVFREWMAEPDPSELWGDTQVTNHGYVVCDHRVTPTHVLVSYDGAPDPVTGEPNPLAGNIPLAIDRRTGERVEETVPLLVFHWPEMPLRHHVGMWVEQAAVEGTTIVPLGGLAGVNAMEAIRALNSGWIATLPLAKGTIVRMLEHGSANLSLGDLAARFRSERGRRSARTTCVKLEAAGVSLRVDGFALLPILEFIDRE